MVHFWPGKRRQLVNGIARNAPFRNKTHTHLFAHLLIFLLSWNSTLKLNSKWRNTVRILQKSRNISGEISMAWFNFHFTFEAHPNDSKGKFFAKPRPKYRCTTHKCHTASEKFATDRYRYLINNKIHINSLCFAGEKVRLQLSFGEMSLSKFIYIYKFWVEKSTSANYARNRDEM